MTMQWNLNEAFGNVPSADLELGDLLGLLDADLLNVLAGTDHGHEILDLLELLRHIVLDLTTENTEEAIKTEFGWSVERIHL